MRFCASAVVKSIMKYSYAKPCSLNSSHSKLLRSKFTENSMKRNKKVCNSKRLMEDEYSLQMCAPNQIQNMRQLSIELNEDR